MVQYFTIPGFGGNDENHWQSFWEKTIPNCHRIEQVDWEKARCDEWVNVVEKTLSAHDLSQSILIGHSLGVATIINWANKHGKTIKGAFLVAPTDVENLAEPLDAVGFAPLPKEKLNFPSIVIASTNDIWIPIQKAQEFANSWGSEFVNIGEKGHINSDSKLGDWTEGKKLLNKLSQ